MTITLFLTLILANSPFEKFFDFVDSLKSAEADFVETVRYPDIDFERTFTGHAYLVTPNKLRIDFLSPQKQTLLLLDSVYILVSPDAEQPMVRQEFTFLIPQNSQELRKNFKITMTQSDSSYIFSVTPNQSGYTGSVTIEFAKNGFRVLSMTIYDVSTEMHYRFKKLKLNVELPDSLFSIAEVRQ